MTQTAGARPPASRATDSTDVSARAGTDSASRRPAARHAAGPAPPTPRRTRRGPCRPDRRGCRAPSGERGLADPGEPPSRTSEPGTSPPPSTRSSSAMPGRQAVGLGALTSRSGDRPGSRSSGGASAARRRPAPWGARLDQGVPLAAARAAARPREREVPALLADEVGAGGHQVVSVRGP